MAAPARPAQNAAPAQGHGLGANGAASAAEREAAFVDTLVEDVATFNDLFMEREEEHVIRLRSLEDAAAAAHTAEQAQALKSSSLACLCLLLGLNVEPCQAQCLLCAVPVAMLHSPAGMPTSAS